MYNRYSRCTEKIEDPVLRKNVGELLEYAGVIASYNRKKMEENPSDYDGARNDLRSTMTEVHGQQPKEENGKKQDRLWEAIMTIRPTMLAARVPKRFIFIIEQELWALARENQAKDDFFSFLHKQMAERQVVGWRTLISGGVIVERKRVGESATIVLHAFPVRIPRDIMKEVGLKFTTKPDNVQAHKAAVTKMIERGLVPAKVGEALKVLAEDIYTYLGIK